MKRMTSQKLKRGKLSVKRDAPFKKPSSSLYKARAATVLKKAFELSELCDVDVCIIWYDREGNLVKTWPEKEENKVRAMAERYSMLSEQERNKKSTNLSGFLNKKMIHDKKESLKANDGKFLETVLGLEDSLQTRLREIKDCLQRFDLDQPLQDLPSDPSLNYGESSFVDVSTTNTSTSSSKFSVLLYNHENGMFTQLPNSSSALIPSFQQQPPQQDQDYYGTSNYMDLLLGEQGYNNNWNLLPLPMQTQTLNLEQIMQTQPSFGMMLS